MAPARHFVSLRTENCQLSTQPPLTTPVPAAFSSETTRRAARNVTALTLSNVVSKGVLFAWQLLLARWLGAEGYGIYGTIGALLAVGAALPEFGMGMIVIRDVANRPQAAGRYLGASLALQPALAALGYTLLLIASWLLGYDAELRALLALAAVGLLVDALGNIPHNQLLAQERMVLPAIISTGHIALLVALAAVALTADTGLWGLYAASLAAGGARVLVYWIALRRTGARPHFPVDRAVARSLLINGAPIVLTAFLVLAYQHADKLITTAIIGADGTGQLTAAFVISFGVIELLSSTVLVALFPVMSRVYGSGQQPLFELMLEKLSFFTLLMSVPVGVLTSLLAVPLSALLFGAEFTSTAAVLRVLIWYTVVTMVANVFAQGLLIQNRQRRLLAIRAGGLGLNIALLLILLPRLDVPGAALASLLAESVVLALMVRQYRLSAAWWRASLRRVWRVAAAGAALAAVVLALRAVHPLLAVAAGLPAYGGIILALRTLGADDWDLLRRVAAAAPGGARMARFWTRGAA